MPSFPKPTFEFEYSATEEIKALRDYRKNAPGRNIPKKAANRLLLATWNIANLGLQDRLERDYQTIAELISWFDLIAVQEVNDDLSGLRAIQAQLPAKYRLLFSDASGNNERLTYIYDSSKVKALEKVGEVTIPPSDLKHIRLDGVQVKFDGFDRAPYIAAFKAGSLTFQLVNVHLYFGKENETASMDRRCLEAYAVARWADLRSKSKYAYAKDIIALGDFNLPKVDPLDPIYKALTRRGLHLPKHSTEIGSNLGSDKHYDQIAFLPSETQDDFTGNSGVFDFDGALFRKLWQTRTPAQFFAYMRYYMSDHRILWAEFKT